MLSLVIKQVSLSLDSLSVITVLSRVTEKSFHLLVVSLVQTFRNGNSFVDFDLIAATAGITAIELSFLNSPANRT